MLFNSYGFLFVFLPLTLAGYFALARLSHAAAAAWLAAASLAFYGYWNPAYVGLLLASIVANYALGLAIARARAARHRSRQRTLLAGAIAANLALLGYYKYANFFLESVGGLAGASLSLGEIILPLGISFFTFTQIAYLVDTHQGKASEPSFVHYVLFVTYFPHLVAGPVLHHKEMMPQFAQPAAYRPDAGNFAVGLTIFFIGLFKKVIVADGIGASVAPVFGAPAAGVALSFADAWGGALCYTLQLYFDFSGYSDMAIGLSRLFGVVLPLNFHSPYQAASIIEFWQRWHMTLSRFLRDYLYIPLGGNRHGAARRHVNLMATMLLGGLWHGAGWTFVLWGGLHGIFLVINHAWRALSPARLPRVLSVLLTFLAAVVGWVFFRADSVGAALAILWAMAGGNGLAAAPGAGGLVDARTFAAIAALLAAVWFLPNTQQLMRDYRPALGVPEESRAGPAWIPAWRPGLVAALLVWLAGFAAIVNLNRQSAFLYFQF